MTGSNDLVINRHAPILISNSSPMQLLVAAVLAHARGSWIVPLKIPEHERMELKSLFVTVAKYQNADHARIIHDAYPPLDEFIETSDTALLFTQGETIPQDVQKTLLDYRSNYSAILVVLTSDPFSSQNDNATLGWSEEFRQAFVQPMLRWPRWEERTEDQIDLVRALHARLSMPGGKPAPELSEAVLDIFRAKHFHGTSIVDRFLKMGLQTYIQRQSTGPLVADHFINRRALKLLSSHRTLPPISVVEGGKPAS